MTLTKQPSLPAHEVRNWLGRYVLGLAGALGGWLLVAPDALLPLESSDRIASAEIMIPFLLGQVTAVFAFYARPQSPSRLVAIPAWVVKAPPLIVTALLLIEFAALAIGGMSQSAHVTPSPERLRAMLTFCVAILNASTVAVVARYFDAPRAASKVGRDVA